MLTGEYVSAVAFKDDAASIPEILRNESIVDVEIPVRGLLVKESVVVCNASKNQVEVQSSNISHFCTGTFNYPLFLKVNQGNRILMCRLSDLLVYSGKLFLSDFRFIDQAWINRQWDRVQPKLPLFVSVIKNNKKTKANLFDISQTGMCILIDKSAIEDEQDLIGSEYSVFAHFPPKDALCTINGRVVQSRPISENLLRLGLDIEMPKKESRIVAHYLTLRKKEILDELFLNFLELLNYRDIKDQYF